MHLCVQRLHVQAVELSSELFDIQSNWEYDNSFLKGNISLIFLSACHGNIKLWVLLDGEQIPVAEHMRASGLSVQS